MSDLAASQSQLTGAQILARLNALEANTLRDVNAIVPNRTRTIQSERIAAGWRKPPGVKLAEYNLSS